MQTRKLLILLAIALWVLGACGGGEEPTPTPPPQPTFTPTPAPTNTPALTATPTAAPTEAPTATATAAAVAMPESPLAAPESPLPAPVEAAAPPPPPPVAERIAGFWQLETVRLANGSETPLSDPSLFRLALWRTGTAAVLADCNTGQGRLVPGEGDAFRFEFAFSATTCAPDSLSAPFMRSLEASSAFTLADGRLALFYGADMNQLVLAPVPVEPATNPNILPWSRLQNTTFNVEGTPAGDNQAPLIAGQFLAPTAPGAATVFSVKLAPFRAYGDLDGDELLDVVTLLKVEPGDGTVRHYLTPVLNIGSGLPLPLPGELLGAAVQLHDLAIVDQQVIAAYTATNSEGSVQPAVRRTYTLDNNVLAMAAETPLATVPAPAEMVAPVRDLVLSPEAPTVLTGTLAFSGTQPLRFAAQAGQQLSVTVSSTYGDVWLSVQGEGDGMVLRSLAAEDSAFAGALPTGQNYLVTLHGVGSATPYTVTLTLADSQSAAP